MLFSFSRNILGMASKSENQQKTYNKAHYLQPLLSTAPKSSSHSSCVPLVQ